MLAMNEFTTLNTKENVDYLTFDRLSEIPFIRHGFSTKNGGVSKGIFATMNLASQEVMIKKLFLQIIIDCLVL